MNVPSRDDEIGILILAGGMASRLPGKLMLDAGGIALLARVYRNVTGGTPRGEVLITCNEASRIAIRRLLPVPVVVDRWPERGPLGGMLTGFEAMRAARVFVAAADAPFVDAKLIDALVEHWKDGDECVVPRSGEPDDSRLQPLAALYDRRAFLREGPQILHSDRAAVHRVVERLCARLLPYGVERTFRNVNTPSDYAALRAALASGRGTRSAGEEADSKPEPSTRL